MLVFARHYGFYIAALGQTGGVFLRALMYMCMQGMGEKNTFRSPLSEYQFGENDFCPCPVFEAAVSVLGKENVLPNSPRN